MSGAPGWTASRTPPPWTVTSWAPCWSPPGLGTSGEHALISLSALNGLRVSDATGAGIEHLGLERGHRTLTITRKVAACSHAAWRPGPCHPPSRPRGGNGPQP